MDADVVVLTCFLLDADASVVPRSLLIAKLYDSEYACYIIGVLFFGAAGTHAK